MIKRIVFFACLILLSCNLTFSQPVVYHLIKSETVSSSIVKLTMMVYGKSKKTIDTDAKCAAVRAVLFDGCPNTLFMKPLLEDGEATSFQQYSSYFHNLYNCRLDDFILEYYPVSKFKGGDKSKGTLYEIQLNVLQLRKDLEKNGIRRKMGI